MIKTQAKRRLPFAFDELRVELIAYSGPESKAIGRRESIQKILGLMVNNLQVRGRPRKNVKGESDAA